MLPEKPLRTDFGVKKSALPMVFLFELRQIAGHLPSSRALLTFQGATHTLNNKADSKRGPRESSVFFQRPLCFLAKRQHIKGSIRKSPKHQAAAACLPKCRKVLLASALLFSESARSFADFPLCFEKRPSHSLSLF